MASEEREKPASQKAAADMKLRITHGVFEDTLHPPRFLRRINSPTPTSRGGQTKGTHTTPRTGPEQTQKLRSIFVRLFRFDGKEAARATEWRT